MKLFSRRNKTEADTGPELVLHVEGMHCTSCGLLIDDELEDIPGVRSSRTDVKAGRTTVRLEDGADVDAAMLVAAVEQAGDYTARPAN
ncbi:heavy-metal-associated domain-containing protein [Streptomyces sp. NPDC059909]|uniref:heavy-metal-associated domain-containing protein n=1 Tax=Streptomyces sp. NPDC059909 TaxID=3346998 RepID=UPI003660050D